MQHPDLQSQVKGDVFAPGSEGYDKARMPWNLSVMQSPELIVLAQDDDDVTAAVRYAKENDLPVAVMNTGHGIARAADGALLIVLSRMKDVAVDPARQIARVGAGAIWADVLEKAQDEGLAPLMGSSSKVGAVGYTLGGGMGWLAHRYGLALDHVLSFDLVTAQGEKIRASEAENTELFWGLRGAGAGLGIITAMEIRLVPVTKVYAGKLIYPAEDAKAVFTRYRDWIKALEDDWSTSIAIEHIPPLPAVPEFLRGRSVVTIRGCSCGAAEHAADAVLSWLMWKKPMVNQFREMPFREADQISEDPEGPVPAAASSLILKEFSDDVIDKIIRGAFAFGDGGPLLQAQVFPGGGAVGNGPAEGTAFSQRGAPFTLEFIGMIPTPEAGAAFHEIVGSFRADLSPHAASGVCLNFLAGEEKWDRGREAFSPENLERLSRLKKQIDPDNRFRFGLDLSPQGAPKAAG